MNDYLRESFSYFGLYLKMFRAKKEVTPKRVPFGTNKEQYFLYYEPKERKSDQIIFWVHGGGWNAGNPQFFDFVGQSMARMGYRAVLPGYRLSPKYRYPCQIEDVCNGYKAAMRYLKGQGVDTAKVIVSGSSAGAHLSSILCYCKKVQEKYHVDVSNIKGYIGIGGPYSFRQDSGKTLKILLDMLFRKGYDRRNGEPLSLAGKSSIPMLLIQSRHDGLIPYACAEEFLRKIKEMGGRGELYSVSDKKNTHSWYTAGMFLLNRKEFMALDRFYSRIEETEKEERGTVALENGIISRKALRSRQQRLRRQKWQKRKKSYFGD